VASACAQVASHSSLRFNTGAAKARKPLPSCLRMSTASLAWRQLNVFRLNSRRAVGRKLGKAKPMNKRIALKFFSARSFDVIIRQAPVQAMHSPQQTPKDRPTLTQDGDLPVEARSSVDSAKMDRTETTGHFLNRKHPVWNGSDRTAWPTSTSSLR
jgi:hypothetical protein